MASAKRAPKLKPYRVSYYFADAVVNGKARLYYRIIKATSPQDAQAELLRVFAGAPGQPVIVKSYLTGSSYKPFRRTKPVYVTVSLPSGVTSSTAHSFTGTFTSTSVPVTGPVSISSTATFRTPAKVDPLAPCKYHPNAPLDANGRCTALDPQYQPPSLDFTRISPSPVVFPVDLLPGDAAGAQEAFAEETREPGLEAKQDNASVPEPDYRDGNIPCDIGEIASAKVKYVPCEDPATCGSPEHGQCEPCANANVEPAGDEVTGITAHDEVTGVEQEDEISCGDPDCIFCKEEVAEASGAIQAAGVGTQSEYDKYRAALANQVVNDADKLTNGDTTSNRVTRVITVVALLAVIGIGGYFILHGLHLIK